MLKLEDFIREFPVIRMTDRDVEIPVLLEFIHKIFPIDSLLDIGCHGTHNYYANELRKFVNHYDGVDILPDSETAKILDHYIVGNALEFPYTRQFDTVVCLSAIEHSGVSTYKKTNIQEEQNQLFKQCLDLARKHLWISFHIGQEYVYPDEFSTITGEQLELWEKLTQDYKVTERFFYNQGPQAKHPWYEHAKRDVAVRIPYIDYIGNQSVAILEIDKS